MKLRHNTRARARRWSRGQLAATGGVLIMLLAMTACSGPAGSASNNSSSPGPHPDKTLTIGIGSAANSIDPFKIDGTALWYLELAYDPLIYMASDGSLQPRLAQSWKYIGTGNKVFEIKLRPGVKFSDGSPLTAEVVKANLEQYRNSPSTAAKLASVASVTVADPLTVRLNLSQPDPGLPMVLSEFYGAGNMVSGAALKDQAKLATRTFGAGPYEIDASATVPGDHYTYKPNPHYWNKSGILNGEVVIKVLPNQDTAVEAVQTGEVNVLGATSPATDSSAKAAGLQVASIPQSFVGLALADRSGKTLAALGDVRVRQALNYAVDRKTLAGGLVGTFGGPDPTDQLALPGQDGYNDKTFYPYDPAKAKQLLAEAGYPHGFTLPVLSQSGVTPLLEVLANEYKAIGVTLKLTDAGSNTGQYIQDMSSARFPAFAIAYGALPIHLMAPDLFLSGAFWNPFHDTDPQMVSLYKQAAAAGPSAEADLDQQLMAHLTEQAWFVPVLWQPVSFYAQSDVAGLAVSRGRPVPDPVEWGFSS